MKRKVPKARDLTYCDCAQCGQEVLGDRWWSWYHSLSNGTRKAMGGVVSGRIDGRPYCGPCLASRRAPGHSGPKDDISPAQEGAIRTMEDGL